MRSARRLYVHGVSVEAWTARYGVEPFTHPCSECGAPCTTSIPFVQGELRGLQAPECECGNALTPYAFVRDPARGDLLDGLFASEVKR